MCKYTNIDCFDRVEEGDDKSTLDLIANLAQEVTELKRKLSDLREATQTQVYEDNERIEMLTDDVVMLDERTRDIAVGNKTEPKLKKVVFEYVE